MAKRRRHPRTHRLHPAIPMTFDFIVSDECHRSIYGSGGKSSNTSMPLIGLTATPSTLWASSTKTSSRIPLRTLRHRRRQRRLRNLPHQNTRLRKRRNCRSQRHSTSIRDRHPQTPLPRTRPRPPTPPDLDRSVLNPNQIEPSSKPTKQCLQRPLPERSGEWLPKTLIFAKDDNHAEEIVISPAKSSHKATSSPKSPITGTEDPKALIKAFRVDPFPASPSPWT